MDREEHLSETKKQIDQLIDRILDLMDKPDNEKTLGAHIGNSLMPIDLVMLIRKRTKHFKNDSVKEIDVRLYRADCWLYLENRLSEVIS